MLCERCTNIVFRPNSQHWHNIVTTLANSDQCSGNVQATFCECWDNVAPQHWGTMLRKHSGHIVWMLVPNVADWHWDNAWTLSQHQCRMLYLVSSGPEWQLHSYLNFLHICIINMHFCCHNHIYKHVFLLTMAVELNLRWIFKKFPQ